jgi:hypothetical protein
MGGTTNKSMAEMPSVWFRRKVRHPWLCGPRRLTMYLATLDCATSNPSLSSSPWMRGAPKRIFDTHPPDQRAQVHLDLSSPSQWTQLPTPIAAKASPMPTHECPGTDNREDLQDRGKPAIQLNQEPAIIVRQPDPAMHLTQQNDQLMSENCILCLKSALRLEWCGQDGQYET